MTPLFSFVNDGESSFLFFFPLKNIIYSILLYWGFVTVHGLSLVAASRGCSPVMVPRLLIAVASLVVKHGFTCCGVQASLVVGPGLQSTDLMWCTGFTVPWHVGSPWIRD